jgi:acetoin utilization deacetylase AcuC-like enzyme
MSVGAGGYTSSADATGPVAGYDPVLGKVDRRNKKQKNYPKEYVQMFRDANKGNRLKSVLK